MNFDASDLFGTTPPRTRIRNKSKMAKVNGGLKGCTEVSDRKISLLRGVVRAEGVNSPRSSMRKKKTEIRSHQRDAKVTGIESVEKDDRDAFGNTSIIIGSRGASASPAVLTLGTSQPFRCLAASCVSESDFAEPAPKNKPDSHGPKSKGVKKRPKHRFPKPSSSDQRRIRYFQRLRQVVAAGNNKQGQIDSDRTVVDNKGQRYDVRRSELIWLELQAWYNDCTILQQDQLLFSARQTMVADVLSFVSVFHFDCRYLSYFEKLKNKIYTILKQMPEVVCEQCDTSLSNSDMSFSSQMSEDEIDASYSDLNFSRENSYQEEEGQSKNSISVSFKFSDVLSIKKEEEHPEQRTKLLKHNLLPDKKFLQMQENAMIKVGEILKLLCIVENLYPSSSALAKDYPFYKDDTFQNKVESMCSWFNITSDLRGKFFTLLRFFFPSSDNHALTEDGEHNASIAQEGMSSNHNMNFLPIDITESTLDEAIRNNTNRTLKQQSVKSILQTFLTKHFKGLYRAKMNMMPNSHYINYEELMESEHPSSKDPDIHFAHFTIGTEPESERTVKSAKLLKTFSSDVQQQQKCELNKIFEHINTVFSDFEYKVCKDTCRDAIFEEAAPVSPSDNETAVFGLPSLHPLYTFFPSLLFATMRHCMHLRIEQAMPFFHNSASSICLLTAKQLVLESKEMLECGLLARDIFYFFIIDLGDEHLENEFLESVASYDEDLHSMITTYLDCLNTWLVRMLGDLPHAPRGFQDILEQEWEFANKITPCIDFDCVVTCACSFIKISSDIVNSTRDFLVSAVGALIQSQNPEADLDFGRHVSIEEVEEYDHVPRHMSESSVESNNSLSKQRFYSQTSLSRPQAGVLWFHRQRSESPHLSRHNSLPSSSSVTPVSSPIELERQASSSSSTSNSSLPWLQYKHSASHLESQRRYLFELCRAVRELFHETRERAIRILSFGKRLRKSVEPAIGFDLFSPGEESHRNVEFPELCSYCKLLESLQNEGYVLVDFSEISSELKQHNLNNSNSNGSSNTDREDYVNLDSYWVFVPKSITPSETPPDSPRTTDVDDGMSSSPVIWNAIKNALFCHLQGSNQHDTLGKGESGSSVVNSLIFVKKPQYSERAAANELRRKSEVQLPAERKLRNKRSKKPNANSMGTHKSKSDGNLLHRHHSGQDGASYGCSEGCSLWDGDVIKISDREHDPYSTECINFLHMMCKSFELPHDITVILASADDLGVTRKELSNLFAFSAKLVVAQKPIVRSIKDSLNRFRLEIIHLCNALMTSIDKALKYLDSQSQIILKHGVSRAGSWDMDSRQQVKSEVNEVMQSCFNFGFEFIKEATRITSGDFRTEMDKMHVEFAKQWMEYVLKHREKGKGYRPRWASQGLTFVVSIDSSFLLTLKEEEFSNLKTQIDEFISFLIGEAPSPAKKAPDTSLHKVSKSLSTLQIPDDDQPQVLRSLSNSASYVESDVVSSAEDWSKNPSSNGKDFNEGYKKLPINRIREAIEEMEEDIDFQRTDSKTIGRITDAPRASPIVNLGVRTVNFRWQRGTKVGEGGFGRVYTCVNVDTGKILAMKEVKFQPNDHQKIRSALDEYTNFEGIKHRNLVQYYGVELHRVEMYIFMEYCDGGTLEEMCKMSLPETMIRKYTSQILSAVNALHVKGIVHRDIKGSNIFLTSSGIVKLGDFGSALKLKDKYKTTPGEMISHIGTTMAYTAPEVINSSEKVGYGRAADIWSLGCVVIEMASGKKPWHDLESFQIMFKVGSGVAPNIPPCLSEDGKKFVQLCTRSDPKLRWNAEQLLGHPFVKVATFEE